MELRPYQEETIVRVRNAMCQGARRVVMVGPTGSGKTRTAAEMVRRAVAGGKRCLWLAHRAELIDQAAKTLTELGLIVGAICATATTPPNPFAPIQVASVQTLLARGERPLADLIIPDEAHHFADAAETFSSLLNSYPRALIVGPTATPERGDGCGLRGCFDAIVVGATVSELTELGWLVSCEIFHPGRALKPGELAQNPVDAYLEHARGQSAIAFVRSVALAREYATDFNRRGVSASAITADMPWSERRVCLDGFKGGTVRVLTSVAVLTEGFDAPNASCCILARGCGSAGLYLQMVGRILRIHPGKSRATLLDLRGVCHEHGRPEDDRQYSLDGRGIQLKDPNKYCPVCGTPRTPPDACTNSACGYVPTGDDAAAKPDKITGDPLVRYANKRAESADERLRTVARWYADGIIGNKYKAGWLYAKVKAVYGRDLSRTEFSEAGRLAESKMVASQPAIDSSAGDT